MLIVPPALEEAGLKPCFIVDDQTPPLNNGAKTDATATRSRAGIVGGVEGTGVWVRFDEAPPAQPPAGRMMNGLALATCDRALAAGLAPEWVHLLPQGQMTGLQTTGRDGRKFDLADPGAIVLAPWAAGIDLPIDYEHQNDRPGTPKVGQRTMARCQRRAGSRL